jgi:hypothetical protein
MSWQSAAGICRNHSNWVDEVPEKKKTESYANLTIDELITHNCLHAFGFVKGSFVQLPFVMSLHEKVFTESLDSLGVLR